MSITSSWKGLAQESATGGLSQSLIVWSCISVRSVCSPLRGETFISVLQGSPTLAQRTSLLATTGSKWQLPPNEEGCCVPVCRVCVVPLLFWLVGAGWWRISRSRLPQHEWYEAGGLHACCCLPVPAPSSRLLLRSPLVSWRCPLDWAAPAFARRNCVLGFAPVTRPRPIKYSQCPPQIAHHTIRHQGVMGEEESPSIHCTPCWAAWGKGKSLLSLRACFAGGFLTLVLKGSETRRLAEAHACLWKCSSPLGGGDVPKMMALGQPVNASPS